MSNTLFLWLIFGGWVFMFVLCALILFKKRVGATSFTSAAVTVGLITGFATAAKTGSAGWGFAFLTFALLCGGALTVLSRHSKAASTS